MEIADLRSKLRSAAPDLVGYVFDTFAEQRIRPFRPNRAPKVVNDPVWNIIRLDPFDVALLDMPFMQRLRRVRQLGLAHLVYTGAHHSRLEHSLGVRHAAQKMYRSFISGERGTVLSLHPRFERAVTMAALLHDCGHVAFSHAGEAVLADLFGDAFKKVAAVLGDCFKDPLADERGDYSTVKAKPAELMAALIVLSPRMKEVINDSNDDDRPSDNDLGTVAALILGRPFKLRYRGKDESGESGSLQFAKRIVSGDLDADKIDYVVRDGFYAGIPTAADVHRLIAQIGRVDLREGIVASGMKPPFGGINPDVYHLFGLNAAGFSAYEMFVASRAHLHHRIYQHHKVRVAEAMLKRLLKRHIEKRYGGGEKLAETFDLLFHPSGDDGVLARIYREAEEGGDRYVTVLVERLWARDLPRRAFSISRSDVADQTSNRLPDLIPQLKNQEHQKSIEDTVTGYLGAEADDPGNMLIVDCADRRTVEEDPDIWTYTQGVTKNIALIKPFVDVEQQANAYHGLKNQEWIFTDEPDRAKVAALSAAELARRHGIWFDSKAAVRAKVDLRDYQQALSDLAKEPALQVIQPELENLRVSAHERRLRVTRDDLLSELPRSWGRTLAMQKAEEIADSLSRIGMSEAFHNDLMVSLRVMKYILNFVGAKWRNVNYFCIAKNSGKKQEACFQDDITTIMEADTAACDEFKPLNQVKIGNGFVDLLAEYKDGGSKPVIVELKVENKKFDAIADSHAGQALQYTRDNCSRVAILLAAFTDSTNRMSSDCIRVYRPNDPKVHAAVIVVGLQQASIRPSDAGKLAVRA